MNLKELKPHIHFKQTSPTEGIVYSDLQYSPYIESKMKTKKKKRTICIEIRNALYHKTICHNGELAKKNTELSVKVNDLENKCKEYETYIHRKRWWQFWK